MSRGSGAESKLLRKSQSMPHISSQHYRGYHEFVNGSTGSCSLLDQIGAEPTHYAPSANRHHQANRHSGTHHHHHHHAQRSSSGRSNPTNNTSRENGHDLGEKAPYSARLVADLRQLMTLRQHYYPEGGWGWVLVVVCFLVQSISHGLHLSLGMLALSVMNEFHRSMVASLSLCALSFGVGLAFSPVTISLCKRKSSRLVAVIGGLVTALGCLFTSFALQFHQILFSFGIMVGVGVNITRDCSTIMVAQYFKKKRELVEIFVVAGSGCGIILMSIFYKTSIETFGWRLGLQAITCTVFATFILGLFYRSASLYHPQRRAILHLKNQRRKVKDKNKMSNRPPFFDFKTLHSKTVRILLLSSGVSAFGLYTPIFLLGRSMQLDGISPKALHIQTYMGVAWIAGCAVFGFLVVRNSVECRIARQYLCQMSGAMCGVSMLALTGVGNNFEGYVMFVWIYGIFCGGYHYALKMYTYERVRARNFARAWSFVQCAQALPIMVGVPFAGFLSEAISPKSGYVFSFLCTTTGSALLFLVDVHKRNISQQQRHKHTRSNGTQHYCMSDDCPKNRKLSFSNEPDNDAPGFVFPIANSVGVAGAVNGAPGVAAGAHLPSNVNAELLLNHLSDDLLVENGATLLVAAGDKAELTCISEEGIADMDLPDNLFDDFDFIGDCITSCNKVENYLMLSEFENNLNVELPPAHTKHTAKCPIALYAAEQQRQQKVSSMAGATVSMCHSLCNLRSIDYSGTP